MLAMKARKDVVVEALGNHTIYFSAICYGVNPPGPSTNLSMCIDRERERCITAITPQTCNNLSVGGVLTRIDNR